MQQDIRFKRIRQKLIEKARAGELINYGEFIYGGYRVARGQGKPWQIGTVLAEICEYEHNNRRPLLSTICVLKQTGMPSVGFWDLEFIPDSIRNGTQVQQRRFWEPKRDAVFGYWHNT